MRITVIGAGNLGTNLVHALLQAGHTIDQVWSRSKASLEKMQTLGVKNVLCDIKECEASSDLYIVAVKDSVLSDIVRQLPKNAFVVHTAGSMPMDTIEHKRRGVFYPMQTFSKTRLVDFCDIPIFIEASNPDDLITLHKLAVTLSQHVYELPSEKRKYLHVAAVFACNMVNHCYDLASQVLESEGIPFSVMLPLIDETAGKLHSMTPHDAQTGPAVRWDENVIQRHLDMLDDEKRKIYELLSNSIHNNR